MDGNAVTQETVATAAGIPLGSVAQATTKTIRFRAIVAAESAFPYGTSTLTNGVTVSTDNAGSQTDYAFVVVTRSNPIIIGGNHYELSIQKFGRNATKGETTEQSRVVAYPDNSLEFIIHVKSLSDIAVTNVIVRDTLPAGITYVANSTSLNGSAVGNDTLMTAGGLNIGSLNPGQEAIVRFFGLVGATSLFPTGLSTIVNVAYTHADNIPELMAQLPVVISNGGSVLPGNVSTGAEGTLWMSLFVSGFVTFMYMLYTRTTLFRKREIEGMIEDEAKDKEKFNFEDKNTA